MSHNNAGPEKMARLLKSAGKPLVFAAAGGIFGYALSFLSVKIGST
jgi:hypothetical protein